MEVPASRSDSSIDDRLHRAARWSFLTLIDPVLAFALPTPCFVCARPLRGWHTKGACSSCWTALAVPPTPTCPGCGLPRPPGTDLLSPAGGRCPGCVLAPPVSDAVQAAVVYDRTARAFLLRAKIGLRRELLPCLGARLARALGRAGLDVDCTGVTSVPCHPWTRLRRGFSPARELARGVCRELRLTYRPRLLRRRHLGRQVKGLGIRGRQREVRGAFAPCRPVAGERLLLVDDVMTTGATLAACARCLKDAGAAEVRGAVWARTLGGPV